MQEFLNLNNICIFESEASSDKVKVPHPDGGAQRMRVTFEGLRMPNMQAGIKWEGEGPEALRSLCGFHRGGRCKLIMVSRIKDLYSSCFIIFGYRNSFYFILGVEGGGRKWDASELT